MLRRGVVALFAFFAVGGWAGIASATTPAPSPPPFCFVLKSGALPTCEQNADGTWTALYPNGQITHDDGSSGTSHTKRDIEIAIVVIAILGIGGIAWWQWGPLKGRGLGPS